MFFSVGGRRDTLFAASVKELLPDAMVYMYTRTGEEGVDFRPEIEREIQAARLFVVFWSEDYLKSDACKHELALARRLAESVDRQKRVLIVPVNRKSPSLTSRWSNPLKSSKELEFVLGEWRFDRTLDPAPDPQKVAEHVRRRLDDAELLGRTLIARPLVVDTIQRAVSRPDFSANEFVYVSGLEGDGRRTALRQYIKSSYANLTERQVPMDSVEGPEDLLPRMQEISGIVATRRADVMQRVTEKQTTALKEIRKLVHQARSSKSYFVLALDRFSGADTVGVPHWIAEVFGKLQSGNAPLVFLVTSSPVTDAALKHHPNAKRVRVPGLDEREMSELVHRLSIEDAKQADWSPARKNLIRQMSGSSPSLCQSIMFALRNEDSLDFLETIALGEEERFSAGMSAVLGYIVNRFKDKPGELLALRVIERFGLASKRAVDEIVIPLLNGGEYDLYSMLEYGLIERLSDDVLRIPPLIQRRLGYILDNQASEGQLDELFAVFSRKMVIAEDEYGAVYASNRAVASLETDAPQDPRFALYLTTASLFKGGLERYLEHDFVRAHSILLRAMDKLTSGATIDLSAQIEVARYFGLAAARCGLGEGVQRACQFLEFELEKTPRKKQGKAMASFLRGFEARQAGRYRDAIEEFESARKALVDVRFAERQRGAVLTELSRAYLRKDPPDYDKAVAFAEEAYKEKDVAHNLSGLIRARLHRTFSRTYTAKSKFDAEIQDVRALIAELKLICARTDRDFHLFREAELELIVALRRSRAGASPLDLTRSIDLIEYAFRLRPVHGTQFFLWKLRLLDRKLDHGSRLLTETSRELATGTSLVTKRAADAAKIWSLVRSRSNKGEALEVLRKHQGEMGAWAINFLKRTLQGGGAISVDEVFAVVDRL
ncbi:MAG TPA: toll/interleukin-1 receptor domain-containing protein [Rubrivivax sp.]|nr:toll/interleukin-1 receptor domain-containing protein [Rubrivivax sp.]